MIRLLYNLIWPIGLILFLPGYVVKMFRRGGYRENFWQRLGFYSGRQAERLRDIRPVWFHAVSVGEVNIALKLIHALRGRQPDLRCALTTTTTTGYALARKSVPPWIDLLYSPLDFWPVMQRAFRLINPKGIVLIEAEVWPNLVAEASRRRIPLILANARLSPKSERRFRQFKTIVTPIFQKLDLICVSTDEEAKRWRDLGVEKNRIRVLGSIKYDTDEKSVSAAEPRAFLNKLGIESNRSVLLGGSTHRGEERILADAFCRLRRDFPSLFFVIAPRHVERATEIEQQLRQLGLRLLRRSAPAQSRPFDGLLLDTTGELRDWYSIATVVFIGKSLTARGGQNPVEPIIAAKPVIYGPHMENFARLAEELVENGGAARVESAEELTEETRRLLNDSVLRNGMVDAALRVIQPHRGATARTAALIDQVISKSPAFQNSNADLQRQSAS
jgi:3-deoxy-D-manno-octulosonic-acid transferase